MKKTDLAYTAGIIDGEGCIYISKRKSKYNRQGYRLQLCVKIASTDEWLCQWLKFAWGGAVRLRVTHTKENKNWSDVWDWTLQTKQAVNMLKLISPYLNLKKPQAELAIKFQKRKVPGINLSDERKAVEEAEFLLMKSMKVKKQKEAL